MAGITKGITFTTTEQITNVKLHTLVDDATISGIVNADISDVAAIADTKLAGITTAGTVNGSALTGLANIPSAAGVIPAANIPATGTSFVTGDWIISTVTTARSGWTNVSATYSNKFMRINATPLTTGGADTDSIALAEENLPAHTHAAGTLTGGAHTHTVTSYGDSGTTYFTRSAQGSATPIEIPTSSGGAVAVTGSTGSVGSGTAFTVDTVPAYVQVVIFQKD